jgi:hypothetical protein
LALYGRPAWLFAARAAPHGHRRQAVGQVCGAGGPGPDGALRKARLRQQIHLGDDAFVSPQQALAKRLSAFLTKKSSNAPARQRKAWARASNQAVRDYLEQLVSGEEGVDAELEALRSMAGRGNSGGLRISRDELYAERLERQRGA